jgi:hypothetical protein
MPVNVGLGFWCLTPLSTIFHGYFVAVSVIGGGNRGTRRKTTDLQQVTDKLHQHNVVSKTPAH